MSYKNRVAIYDQLFNEGVLVALEDTPAFKHTDNIPNLQVKRTSAWIRTLELRLTEYGSLRTIHFVCCPKIFFAKNVLGHYAKVPWAQKTRPTPSLGPLGAVLQFPGSDSLFREDFCFWFFPHKFWHFCLGMHLNLRDLVQKNFWHIFFSKISAFYLTKWNPLGLTRPVQ